MDYYKKYLKYKNKYIKLKNQIGGVHSIPCTSGIAFHNRVGTCWNVSLHMLFIFGTATIDMVQEKLMNDTDLLVEPNIKLFKCLPLDFFNIPFERHDTFNSDFNFFSLDYRIKDDVLINIKAWLQTIKERFIIVLDDIKPMSMPVSMPPTSATLNRSKSLVCEQKHLTDLYELIKKISPRNSGGTYVEVFLSIVFWGIFFCRRLIDYTLLPLYVLPETKLNYNNPLNSHYIRMTEPADTGPLMDIIMASIGICVWFEEHMCSIYKCKNDMTGIEAYVYYDSYRPEKPIIIFDLVSFFEFIIRKIILGKKYYIFQYKHKPLFNIKYPTLRIITNSIFIIDEDATLWYMDDANVAQIITLPTLQGPYMMNSLISRLTEDKNVFNFFQFIILSFSTLNVYQYLLKYKSLYLEYYIINKHINLLELNTFYKQLHTIVGNEIIIVPDPDVSEPYNFPYLNDVFHMESNRSQLGIFDIILNYYKYNVTDEKWLDLLVAPYPDVNINRLISPNNYTILISAMEFDTSCFLTSPQTFPITAKILTRTDININKLCGPPLNWSPLLYAIKTTHIELIKMILNYTGSDIPCDINLPAYTNNDTPLVYSIRIRGDNKYNNDLECLVQPIVDKDVVKLEIVKLLIENDADVNLQCGAYNDTPLLIAIQPTHKSCINIIKALVCAGADINMTGGEHNDTPLIKAIEMNNKKVVKYLCEIYSPLNPDDRECPRQSYTINIDKPGGINNVTPLIASIEKSSLDILDILIDNGADVNQLGGINNVTPLIAAIQLNQQRLALRLIHDASINVNGQGDINNTTPLIAAIKKNQVGIVNLLLQHRLIDVNQSGDINNTTPLIAAIEQQSIDIIKNLLDKHANINMSDLPDNSNDFTTPLVEAIIQAKSLPIPLDLNAQDEISIKKYKSIEIIQLLLSKGADINMHTLIDSPIQLAEESNDRFILNIIQPYITASGDELYDELY